MTAPEPASSPTGDHVKARRFARRAKSARVLVISPSGFVRLALAHRLADLNAVVTLSGERGGVSFEDYEVVIVGPYLNERDRDRVVDELVASGSHAAVIEICDPPDNGSARLIALGHNRLAELAHTLLAAVGEPQAAVAST